MRLGWNVYFQRLNFVLSSALLLISPIMSLMRPSYHMVMAISFLALFPYFVALAYLESIERVKLTYLSPLGLLIIASPKYFGIAPLFAGIVSLLNIKKVKLPSLKNSALLVSLSMILGGLYLLYSYEPSPLFATNFAMLYDVLMIYGVSTHSLPNTFGERPNWRLAFLASLFLLLSYFSTYILFISLVLYFVGAKYYKLKAFYERVKKYKGIARTGNAYLLIGSYTSLLGLMTVISKDVTQFLHYLLLGFVAPHIFTHLPLMIPAILRIRAFKGYCLWTFLFLALSTLTWPSWVSALFFLTALACLIKSYLM